MVVVVVEYNRIVVVEYLESVIFLHRSYPLHIPLDCEQSLSFPSVFRAIEGTSHERTRGEW